MKFIPLVLVVVLVLAGQAFGVWHAERHAEHQLSKDREAFSMMMENWKGKDPRF